MNKKEIINKIKSFSDWMYQFELDGVYTPVLNNHAIEVTNQRINYCIDPLINFCGGSLKGKKILEVTMQNQEDAYQEIAKEDNHTILVPFTGDVNFSESEEIQ